MTNPALHIRDLGRQPYEVVWQCMSHFTNTRTEETVDELWLVEHESVFTQGQAGKPEHILQKTSIPLVQSDRGGQVTYHGPGQLILYPLINLRRRQLGVRDMVTALEELVIQWLSHYRISAYARPDAPGVYVDSDNLMVSTHTNSGTGNSAKIASLGLRIRRGCSFHGVGINIDMDLSPFQYINPCGHEGMSMTQLAQLLNDNVPTLHTVKGELITLFVQYFGIEHVSYLDNPTDILTNVDVNV